MKKGIKASVGVAILSTGLCFNPWSTLSASAVEGNNQPSVQCADCVAGNIPGNQLVTAEEKAKWFDDVEKYGPYLKANSQGHMYLNATAEEIGVTQADYDRVVEAVDGQNLNLQLLRTYMEFDDQGTITSWGVTNPAYNNYYLQLLQMEVKANGGTPQYADGSFHWWGYGIKLNASETERLVELLEVGITTAGLATILATQFGVTAPASAPAGLIAGIAGVSAALVSYYDTGNGVTIGISYAGVPFLYGND